VENRVSNSDPSAVQPIASCYTGSTVPVIKRWKSNIKMRFTETGCGNLDRTEFRTVANTISNVEPSVIL
jgi:hypothetical protein